MGITGTVGKGLLPHVSKMAPELSAHFVHESLRRAIEGVGPLPAAWLAADKALSEAGGDVDAAIHELIEQHVRYAGGQGVLTNIGGGATARGGIPPQPARAGPVPCPPGGGILAPRGP